MQQTYHVTLMLGSSIAATSLGQARALGTSESIKSHMSHNSCQKGVEALADMCPTSSVAAAAAAAAAAVYRD